MAFFKRSRRRRAKDAQNEFLAPTSLAAFSQMSGADQARLAHSLIERPSDGREIEQAS